MTDKYIVKPSRITDERGFVSSIDDYVEHNLPCGGSSGSNNNDSIVNEIMNLDNRIETVEEQVRKLKNESSGTCLEQNIAYKPYGEMSKEVISFLNNKEITDEEYTAFTNMEVTDKAKNILKNMPKVILAGRGEIELIKNKITTLDQTNNFCNDYTDYVNLQTYSVQRDSTSGSLYRLNENLRDIYVDGIKDLIDVVSTNGGASYLLHRTHESEIASIKEQISQLQSVATSNVGGNDDALLIIDQQISSMSNTLTSHTNSIQSLDTRTGSHTASIGSLENRINELETLVNSQKTIISELQSRLTLLEQK